MSVMPCTLAWPRSALMPPPAMPMLPSRVWMMAMVRMFCEPTECCVQPSAYRMVMVLLAAAVSAMYSQTLRNWSFGVPVTLLTRSGV
jgi:hypothetical protein